MAVPALPATGCTNTFSKPERVLKRRNQQRVQAQPARQAQVAASRRPMRIHGCFHGLLDAGGDVGAQVVGNRRAPSSTPSRS